LLVNAVPAHHLDFVRVEVSVERLARKLIEVPNSDRLIS
jgi:hypothetical protein